MAPTQKYLLLKKFKIFTPKEIFGAKFSEIVFFGATFSGFLIKLILQSCVNGAILEILIVEILLGSFFRDDVLLTFLHHQSLAYASFLQSNSSAVPSLLDRSSAAVPPVVNRF